jgi:hypothetical protein
MQTLDFKISGRRARSFSEEPDHLARHHTWVAVGVGVAGIAAGAYGANKQSKDNKAAQATNAGLQEQQNAQAWANYLMTRGVNPAGAATGQLPSNPQAINSRLPLWATANFAKPGAAKTWRKKGSTPAANTLSRGTQFTTGPVSGYGSAQAGSGEKGSSKMNDILIGNPLGIGGKDRNFMDPLGIF